MTVVYLDTSAAMKLVIEEPETDALIASLTDDREQRLVSSWLLHAELHCAAGRRPGETPVDQVRRVLDPVVLFDLTRGDLIAAGTLAPLRSNDAIHLAVAIRLGADALLTYDSELAATALATGLQVLAPA